MFAVMIDDGISAGDEAERERGGEGEHGEEEHLKCGHAESARFDEVDHAVRFARRHSRPAPKDCRP